MKELFKMSLMIILYGLLTMALYEKDIQIAILIMLMIINENIENTRRDNEKRRDI